MTFIAQEVYCGIVGAGSSRKLQCGLRRALVLVHQRVPILLQALAVELHRVRLVSNGCSTQNTTNFSRRETVPALPFVAPRRTELYSAAPLHCSLFIWNGARLYGAAATRTDARTLVSENTCALLHECAGAT